MTRAASRGRGDRGESSTQLVLVTPALLVLLLAVVQLGLWLHASHVAAAASARGAAAAAVRGGTVAEGRAAAQALVDDAGGRSAHAPVVTRDGQAIRAVVELKVARLLPGAPRTVRRVAVTPVERFVPESGR